MENRYTRLASCVHSNDNCGHEGNIEHRIKCQLDRIARIRDKRWVLSEMLRICDSLLRLLQSLSLLVLQVFAGYRSFKHHVWLRLRVCSDVLYRTLNQHLDVSACLL